MKLYTADQIRKIDQETIENSATSAELIQRASKAFVSWFSLKVSRDKNIIIICGTGNNGADGLEISYQLICRGYSVKVLCLEIFSTFSDSYVHFKTKLRQKGHPINTLQNITLEELPKNHIIVDAILGNGLSRPLNCQLSDIINLINRSNREVYAVDVPTGMQSDGKIQGTILRSTATLAFEYPKLSFFVREAAEYIGKWAVLPIGLDTSAADKISTPYHLIDANTIIQLMVDRSPHSFKNNFGHVLLIGGRFGMAGAIILAAQAANRSGAGLVTIATDGSNRVVAQSYCPEAMFQEWNDVETKDRTIGIGPGLGTEAEGYRIIFKILETSTSPMVIDADGLNLLAMHPDLWSKVPEQSILTPHIGEFHRLFRTCESDYDRWQEQLRQSKERDIYIVLKGHNTSISTPKGNLHINSTGNPGMATGGSGDALTGILTGLLAQKYSPLNAACIGVYLHGLSGDIAAKEKSQSAITAMDICNYLPLAIKHLE